MTADRELEFLFPTGESRRVFREQIEIGKRAVGTKIAIEVTSLPERDGQWPVTVTLQDAPTLEELYAAEETVLTVAETAGGVVPG